MLERTDLTKRRKTLKTPGEKSRKEFNEALAMEYKNEFVDAFLLYSKAADTMNALSFAAWTHSDYIHVMGVYSKLLDLLEDDCIEYRKSRGVSDVDHRQQSLEANARKIKDFAKKACHLQRAAVDIKSTDFCLTALRASLSLYGHRWCDIVVDNDVKPSIFPDFLKKTDFELTAIMAKIEDASCLEEVRNSRIYLVSRLLIMIGTSYLRLADTDVATSYFMRAIGLAMRATNKDDGYFQILYVALNHLHHHQSYSDDYAIISFARRIFANPSIYNPTFMDLAKIFQHLSKQGEIRGKVNISLWKIIFDVISERINAGAFNQVANQQGTAFFPDSDFKEAMACPYYRQRFTDMHHKINELELRLSQPSSDMLMMRRHPGNEGAQPDVMQGLLMGSGLFSPKAETRNSGDWQDMASFDFGTGPGFGW